MRLLILFLLSLAACHPERLTTEAPAARPNILFCIADDASFPHMGAYGTSWVSTPNFDRVAQQGLLFTRAYTPNAKCAPSRSCILTGRNSWQLEEAVNHFPYFPAKFGTYAEVLNESGYHVGFTGKGWAPGDPGEVQGQRRQLTGQGYQTHKTTPPTSEVSDNDYAANFEAFLDARSESEPFCFWYGSTEPHRAYEFGAALAKGGKQLKDIDQVPGFWPDTDSVRTDMLDYALEIEYFDQHLGRMLDLLEERGELNNTLVVVTSDNGMPFPRIKGQAYEYANHLPLAIMWPAGITQPGRSVEQLVSFIDFAPTFLAVGQESDSTMQPTTGTSLLDIFRDSIDTARPDYVLIGKERHDVGRPGDVGYPIRGIVRGDFLYLRNHAPDRWPAGNPEAGYLNTDGGATKTVVLNQRRSGTDQYWNLCFGKRPSEEFYQIDRDPACVRNLVHDAEYLAIQEQMRDLMLTELKAQGDPRMLGRGDQLEAYGYADERTRGFYERYMAGEEVRASWVNDSDFEHQ